MRRYVKRRKWTVLGLMMALVALLLGSGPHAVLAEGPPPAERSLEELAAELIRCTDIEGEHYCFGIGFTDLKPGSPEWQTWLSAALTQEDSDTGDMSLATYLRLRARLSPEELRKREEKELTRAREAVGSVKLGNYLLSRGARADPSGVLRTLFLARHSGELTSSESSSTRCAHR
jgi:hypothetical protein